MATDDTFQVGIDLVDNVTPAAESASSALKELEDQITSDTKALSELQKAMRNLKSAAKPNEVEIARVGKAMERVKERLAGAQSNFIRTGGSFKKVAAASKGAGKALADPGPPPTKIQQFTETLTSLQKAASGTPGPVSTVLDGMGKILRMAGSTKIALVALVAAIVAVGVAVLTAAKRLGEFAIASREARRNELLQLESATKLRTVYAMTYGLAADKAKDLQSAVDQVSASVSIGRDQVAGYAAKLERMGVRGKNLAPALDAVSKAASGFGEEQANQTAAWAAGLALTGGNVKKLADRVNSQIGGVVKQKMLSSEVQARKLAESYGALFASVDIEPLLAARKGFNDLFSQATNSGKALKRIFGGMAQPIINAFEWIAKAGKILVQKLIIAFLNIELKWLKFRLAIKKGGDNIGTVFHNVVKEWLVGMAHAGAFLVKLQFKLAVWALKLAWTLIKTLAKGIITAIPFAIQALFGALIGVYDSILTLWDGIDWSKLGTAIVDGIMSGLKGGATEYLNTLVDFGQSAVDAFAGILKIRSPSKVFEGLGVAIPEGVSAGVNKGAPAARRSVADLVEPPTAPPMRAVDPTAGIAPGSGRGRSGAGATITIAELVVNVGSGGSGKGDDGKGADPKTIAQAIKRELENILQTVAVQMGAPVV